jgi:hypothetical protein
MGTGQHVEIEVGWKSAANTLLSVEKGCARFTVFEEVIKQWNFAIKIAIID